MDAETYRQMLFPYAYNILGSADDAKDVVAEVLAKHLLTNELHDVRNEKSYFTKSVINLAITTKRRQRRTLREGEVWLPEPVATEDAADHNLNINEILSYSLLVLLERLSAMERAVFILRESFDYTHEEVATALGITEAHSRKLLSRAKPKLYKPAPSTPVQNEYHKKVLDGFMKAIRDRDLERLEGLMAADIQFYVDGGGKTPFLAGACMGSHTVATLQLNVYERYLKTAQFVFTSVNHQPALLSFVAGRLTSCQIFEVQADKGTILQINAVLDPQKLQSLHSKYQ